MTNGTTESRFPGSGGRPRVAYLVKRYPRYSETFIVNEILAHEAAGFDVEIFALKPPNDTHFQNAISRVRAPVRALTAKGLKASALWSQMARLHEQMPTIGSGLSAALDEDVVHAYQAMMLAMAVREAGIEHIHAHFGSSPATVARLAARFAGLTYSFTAHAKDIYHESFDRDVFIGRHGECGTIVTISEFNRRFLIDDCGFDPDRVFLVYNGLDLDSLRFVEPVSRPRKITAIGRLVEKKGFSDLIDACALLERSKVEFECQIIGAGPLEAELRKQVQRLGLHDRVGLVGPIPQQVAALELGESAVFAAPCVVAEDGDRDGVPTTILEAMALGVPCVSTDVTGIPEVVVHGTTGLVVPQRDPKALADAIEGLLDNQQLASSLARQARNLIEREFDGRQNTARLRAIFDRAKRGRMPLSRSIAGAA